MKSESGITLVVLVITMILMMILAGVSIGISSGTGNGVLSRTKNQVNDQSKTIEDLNNSMDQTLQEQENEWGINSNV